MVRRYGSAAVLVGALLSSSILAAPITYEFQAAVTVELRGPENTDGLSLVTDPAARLFTEGTSVSGRFTYDSSVSGSDIGIGALFPALSGFSGEASGNAFSSGDGAVLVIDDGTDVDPDPLVQDLRDIFLLLAGDDGAAFSGFTLSNGSGDFALNLVTLFFIEGTTPYTPFAAGLPATLPPPAPEAVRVRLGFDDLANPGTVQLVFAEPVSLTAVPLPPAAVLLVSAMTLLRPRRRAPAIR